MATFNRLSRIDQAVLVGGLLTFIVSFFPWYGFSIPKETVGNVTVGGGSYTISAWHSYSTLALLLVIAAAIVFAVALFAPNALREVPVSARWAAAGLASLGALLELIRLITLHHGDGLSIRWGGWLLLIIMIATAVCTVLSAMQSGEAAPWANRGGAAPPADPMTPGTPPTV
jgi:hypothetical protein